MLTVKNKRTGVVGSYPKRQAEWLVSTGRCELVKTKQKAQRKQGSKTIDGLIGTNPDVVIVGIGTETDSEGPEQLNTETENGTEQ